MTKESHAESADSGAPSVQAQIEQREAALKKLRSEYEAKPTDELSREIKRKQDTIFHLKNMSKGDPRERARRAAHTARELTLGRAIK